MATSTLRTALPAIMVGIELLLCGIAPAADSGGNLLRNHDFQDDWITSLPETKNHHWCYSSEFYNRRDFNPDGWICKGTFDWQNADAPAGQRKLVLHGPLAEIEQRVNWDVINDDRQRPGFPDAGGFPELKSPRSTRPAKLVRDLTFRVHLVGHDVPEHAGEILLGLCPAGDIEASSGMGSHTKPLALATQAIPSGNFSTWVEVKLPAADWIDAAGKVAKWNHDDAGPGAVLPAIVQTQIQYKAAAGSVEVSEAELTAADSDAPNLLANSSFELLDEAGYPLNWSHPAKYRYFPPALYYLFNTWHNSTHENRGPVSADTLLVHEGSKSLKMIVAAGDEKAVTSDAIALNQNEPRLLEATAWVKTDHLCTLQIDAIDEEGKRIDCFDFINKAPVSIGTNDWRIIRQIFRPRKALKSVRLMLCARGVNGYTLDDVGQQPQNNVVGTIWWDGIKVTEPESSGEELVARSVKPIDIRQPSAAIPHLSKLDLGERMLGENELSATLANPAKAADFSVRWKCKSSSGRESTNSVGFISVPAGGSTAIHIPYTLEEPCPSAYSEYRGNLAILDAAGKEIAASDIWFGTWTTPVDLRLGAAYLLPEQSQLVRMNFGLSHPAMQQLQTLRLEIIRRGDGKPVTTSTVSASPAAFAAQREKIPADLRGDFANLLLADVDVSKLPIQPFNRPERNWIIRATAFNAAGELLGVADSIPFCRLAHDTPQPPVKSVTIKDGIVRVNDVPWIAWGAIYGHIPRYTGPADPGEGHYRDLHHVPGWNIYDRFNSSSYTREVNDFNCLRAVAGSIGNPRKIDQIFSDHNLYSSTTFIAANPVFSLADLVAADKGQDRLDALLAEVKSSGAIVSTAPGIEEAFGLFTGATPEQIKGLAGVVDYVRKATGKPVMVGHGGYWNRLEFEKVPYFDIYDPETEPLFPANLHTDLAPLLAGRQAAIWLRPQMYEDVPYERWRFHTYVELMRGCRGWQFAHGPGDASLFRGLHGEMEMWKPIAAATDHGPDISIEPWIEHWSRNYSGKTYIIAATTHGLPLGAWKTEEAGDSPAGRARVTTAEVEVRNEANSYGIGETPAVGPAVHGIQYLPSARKWPAGSEVIQWVRMQANAPAKNLVVLVKSDGRWTHAGAWGRYDAGPLRADPKKAYWFLQTFYRHADGFLGWNTALVGKALEFIPADAPAMGALPEVGKWTKLELPLDKIQATGLIDGIAFLHEGGTVHWGRTSIVDLAGHESIIWGDGVQLPPGQLAKARITVPGLKAGGKVKVLFEDRELDAQEAGFTDDFRGQDLYQRYGGGLGTGYGDLPVALHCYEISTSGTR